MHKLIICTLIVCSVISAVALWKGAHTPEVSRHVVAATETIPPVDKIRPTSSTKKSGDLFSPRGQSDPVPRADLIESEAAQPSESIVIKAKPSAAPSTADSASSNSILDMAQLGELSEHRQFLEVHVDAGTCRACSNTKIRSIAISKSCEYDSHQVTQLERIPYVPIEVQTDEHTSYSEVVDETSAGRISAVRITVGVVKRSDSLRNPSITMRLTVFEKCRKLLR